MAIRFEDDPLGCVLEYLYLFKRGEKLDQREWGEVNGITMEATYHSDRDPFIGVAVTASSLDEILCNRMENGDIKLSRRKQISRIFRKLENEQLIDPSTNTDDPETLYRELNDLGEEIFRDGSYLEYFGGPKVIYKEWKNSVCCIWAQDIGCGTGYFVDNDKITTCKHVIKPMIGNEK